MLARREAEREEMAEKAKAARTQREAAKVAAADTSTTRNDRSRDDDKSACFWCG